MPYFITRQGMSTNAH